MKNIKFLFIFIAICINSVAQTSLVIDPQFHYGVVNELMFTNDGRFLISVSDDKTIRIWDVENKNLDRTIRSFSGEGVEGAIYAAALSPDDKYLAIGGYFSENEIRIIDLTKKAEVVLIKGHSNVITSLEFSKDGTQLASSDVTGLINLWDINFLETKIEAVLKLQLIGHKAQVYDISISPNGKQLVSASYDGTLHLWDLSKKSKPVIMKMHMDKVYSCAFTADGERILSGGIKGKVILWDNKGTFKSFFTDLHEPIYSINVVNNEVLISSKSGYHYSVFNSSDKMELPVPFSSVSASAVSNTGIAALAGGGNGDIVLYDFVKNEPVFLFRNTAPSPHTIGISNEGILVFDFDGNGFSKGINLQTLEFLWKLENVSSFNSEKHKENGYALTKLDTYTLSTGFKGKIQMDPRTDGRLRSYTILNEGMIAVGGDFSLKLYTRDGEFLSALKGFNGGITSIAALNNRVSALCTDQTIKVWNVESGELLASFYLASNNEWICWTPQGFYEASSGGEKFMGWQADFSANVLSEYYKSSTYASKFHQPTLVKQTLLLGNFEQAKESVVIEEVPLKEKIIQDLPIVNWITPELLSSALTENTVTIKALVKSSSEIKTLKILVNGRPATKTRGVTIPKSVGEHDMLVEQELVLSHEVNEVRIFVSNQEAKVVSEKRVFTLDNADARGDRSLKVINYSDRPDLYVLSIGVSDYKNSDYNLNFADNDAESIADVFSELGTEVYKDVKVTRLTNSNASKSSILASFETLQANVKAKDMVLLFIASHGINDNGEFYILPYDGDLSNISESLVKWESIATLLGQLPSNVLVLIDACKSGQLGVNLTNSNNTEALRNTSNDENGVVIMAASTGNETAQERPDWEHGAFTLSILEGLKNGKADIKPDGTIFLRELDFYVSERTVELTNNAQHPTTQKPSTISRFSVINLNK